jgi:WD40 repeat protein
VALWLNAQTLAAVAPDGIRLLRIADNTRLLTIKNPSSADIQSAAFAPNNQVIACGFTDGKIRLWEIRSSSLLATLNAHNQSVTSLVFHASGNYLASAASDGSLSLWNISSGSSGKQPTLFHNVQVSTEAIQAISFIPNLNALITGSADGSLHTWVFESNNLETTSAGKGEAIVSLAMHGELGTNGKDERRLAIASADGQVVIWQGSANTTLILEGNSGTVQSLVFSPDGSLLAGGDEKGRVLIWQTSDGKLKAVLEGHAGKVLSVAFSADGKQLVSAAEDGSIKIWGSQQDN